jgi:hypothetical protein
MTVRRSTTRIRSISRYFAGVQLGFQRDLTLAAGANSHAKADESPGLLAMGNPDAQRGQILAAAADAPGRRCLIMIE